MAAPVIGGAVGNCSALVACAGVVVAVAAVAAFAVAGAAVGVEPVSAAAPVAFAVSADTAAAVAVVVESTDSLDCGNFADEQRSVFSQHQLPWHLLRQTMM